MESTSKQYFRRKFGLIGGVIGTGIVLLLVLSSKVSVPLTGSLLPEKGKKAQAIDLSITSSVPATVQSSESIIQTFDIGNNGPASVRSFQIIQPLPSEMTFVSAQASDPITRVQCGKKAKGGLYCNITPGGPGLLMNDHVTVTVAFLTRAPRQMPSCGKTLKTGDARVMSDEKWVIDTHPENDVALGSETTIDCSDITAELSVTGQALPSPVTATDTLRYYVTAMNYGPAKAKGVKIRHTYPAGMRFSGASMQNCQDSPKKREIVCSPGDDELGMQGMMEPGQSVQMELSFTFDSTVKGCEFMTGNALVHAPEGPDGMIDPISDNNEVGITAEVACP